MSDHEKEYAEAVKDAFVPGAIVSETDVDGRITYVNARLTEVSQYTKDELLGKSDSVLIHSEMPDEMMVMISRVIASGKIFTGVIKEQTRNGNYVWVDATIVPVKNRKGRIIKYVNARYLIMDNVMGEYLYNRQVEKLGLN